MKYAKLLVNIVYQLFLMLLIFVGLSTLMVKVVDPMWSGASSSVTAHAMQLSKEKWPSIAATPLKDLYGPSLLDLYDKHLDLYYFVKGTNNPKADYISVRDNKKEYFRERLLKLKLTNKDVDGIKQEIQEMRHTFPYEQKELAANIEKEKRAGLIGKFLLGAMLVISIVLGRAIVVLSRRRAAKKAEQAS